MFPDSDPDRFFRAFSVVFVVWAVIWLSLVIGAIVVGIHFLSKVW